MDRARINTRHVACRIDADAGDLHFSLARLRQKYDLSRFLSGLSAAWRADEVRPTHRAPAKPPRNWSTRRDLFEPVRASQTSLWNTAPAPPVSETVYDWLQVDLDLTALELFEHLQSEYPGAFHVGQLRIPRRRVKHWRINTWRVNAFSACRRT
jgi:hypothetical protein